MPYYRRGYRRGRFGYGYRGYNRSWRRRGWYRRGGVGRSQTQGNRRFSLVVPCQSAFQFTVGAGSFWSDLHAVSPFIVDGTGTLKLANASLVSSNLYRVYTQLYDQVKIDWCSVKLSIMTLVGAGGTVPAVKVVTSWDRNVTYSEIVDGDGIPTPSNIEIGSESESSLIVNNSRAIVSRFNRASDIQERTVFHDCSLMTDPNYHDYTVDGAWFDYNKNIGYCPGLFIALNTASAPSAGSSYVFTASVDVKWHVTFRNPKYGLTGEFKGAVGGAKAVETKAAGKSAPKVLGFSQPDGGVVYSGLLGDVVDRLKTNMHTDGVYEDGEYDHDEDVQFAYEKLGDEVFHQLFKNVYDDDVKKFSLIVDKKDGDVLIKEA